MPKETTIRRRPIKQQRLGGVTISIQKCTKPGYPFYVVMRRNGKRIQERYLKTKGEAQTQAEAWSVATGNSGAQASAEITDADKRNLLDWREALARHGKTIADAVAHYCAHLERCKVSITLNELSDKFQTLKGREKASRRYQDDLRSRLGIFCADFGDRIAADVTTDEISAWLAGLDAAPVTVANYRRILAVLFNYAVSLRACEFNPVDGALKPKIVDAEVGILSVKESLALLRAASERPEILPAIAIGLFAGVRDAEIKRMDWSNVDFESGHITISAGMAKKGSRRLVKIQPALRAWLEPQRQLSGAIWPAGERGRILTEAAREAAGLATWPHNALRHSFASYALAKWQNANALALEMGNSVPVILEHYRELVLPAEAETFWNLTPAVVMGKSNVIRMTSTKAA